MTIVTLCPKCKRIRPCQCGHTDDRRRAANNVRLGRTSAHWIRERKLYLTRTRYCELRHDGCTLIATSVHLVGGGDHRTARPENMRAACHHCHGIEDGGRRPFF